jgi:hypothetical protein
MWDILKGLAAYVLLLLFFATGARLKFMYRWAFKISPFDLPDVFG